MISCPKCNADTQVMETRQTQGHARRRRICKSTSCGVKFTTLETVVSSGMTADSGLVVIPRRKLDAVVRLLRALLPADVPSEPVVTTTNPEDI